MAYMSICRLCLLNWVALNKNGERYTGQRVGDTDHMFQSIEQKFSSWDLLKVSHYPHGHSTHPILIFDKRETTL